MRGNLLTHVLPEHTRNSPRRPIGSKNIRLIEQFRERIMTTFKEKFAALPIEQQSRINEISHEILAEERSWQKLREAARKSRETISRKLGTNREETFTLQQNADLFLHSFAKQVRAKGGRIRIVAEFPDSPNVSFPNFDHFDDGLTDEERIRQTLGMEPDEPIPQEWFEHS